MADTSRRLADVALASGAVAGVGGLAAMNATSVRQDKLAEMQRARRAREQRTSGWPRRIVLGGAFQDRAATELQHIAATENTVTQGSHLRSKRSWVKVNGERSSKKFVDQLAASRVKEEARRSLGERIYRTGRGDRREAQALTQRYGQARRAFQTAGRVRRVGAAVAVGAGLSALAAGSGAELTRRRSGTSSPRPWQQTRTIEGTKTSGDRYRALSSGASASLKDSDGYLRPVPNAAAWIRANGGSR